MSETDFSVLKWPCCGKYTRYSLSVGQACPVQNDSLRMKDEKKLPETLDLEYENKLLSVFFRVSEDTSFPRRDSRSDCV